LRKDLRWARHRMVTPSPFRELIADALNAIVEQAASEILKLYFFSRPSSSSSELKWTELQAWTLVKLLATNPQVSYNSILLDPVFSQDEMSLYELAQAEFISISSSPEGRPTIIKPGRPAFSAAFQVIAQDKVFSAKMELDRFLFLASVEKGVIEKAEEELGRLRKLSTGQVKEIDSRVRYLLKKVQTSQMNIDGLETEMRKVKEVLRSEA
jgi:RNA12 protein